MKLDSHYASPFGICLHNSTNNTYCNIVLIRVGNPQGKTNLVSFKTKPIVSANKFYLSQCQRFWDSIDHDHD